VNEPGRLLSVPPAKGEQASVIRSDPAAPLEDPFQGRPGAHDYRALRDEARVAVFETPPLTAPYELAGRVVVEIAASASVSDFDLWDQLYDVGPDGTSWNLSSPGSALVRASYRDGGPQRQLLRTGEVVTLKMNRLVTANRFLPGHRLRVVLSTAFFPLFSLNPQTGQQEFESAETRAGEVRIESSPGRMSRLILPVIPAED
jgi:putative CocE/NonD family hydrolase